MYSTLEDIFNLATRHGYDLHLNTTIANSKRTVTWWLFSKDERRNYHNYHLSTINQAKEEILYHLVRLPHGGRETHDEVA